MKSRFNRMGYESPYLCDYVEHMHTLCPQYFATTDRWSFLYSVSLGYSTFAIWWIITDGEEWLKELNQQDMRFSSYILSCEVQSHFFNDFKLCLLRSFSLPLASINSFQY